MKRPDLSAVSSDVRDYIEYLESRIVILEAKQDRPAREVVERTEPPTSINIISISQNGFGKRTPRHQYERQHRGGVGIYDLDTTAPDFPAFLVSAGENETLLVFTNKSRAFRYPINRLDPAPVRARGANLLDRIPLEPGEHIAAVLPVQASGNIALASRSGAIRTLRHHLFGEHMRPGTAMYNFNQYGPLAAACWTAGNEDLLMVTEQGMAIRFSEKVVPTQGGQGIRTSEGDRVVAVAPVTDDSLVFMVGADGRGTSRLMSAFAANKSMGGNGKIAMKNDRLVGAVTVEPSDDLFLLSEAGKIIRFKADEVPTTEGSVQGVNCLDARFTKVVAVTKSAARSR